MKKTENSNDSKDVKEEKTTKNVKILDSLQGSVDELEQEDSAGIKSEDNDFFDPSAPMIKNRKLFFTLGLVIIILSVLGLVSTVRFAVSSVRDIANQTALKNEFATFIYPTVITDSPAFDTAQNAPTSVVINAAVWQIILSGDTDKYENDGSYMTISEIDVESSAVSLFGFGVPIQHQSVGSGSNAFEYNASGKNYRVPVDTERITYWPRVSEISNAGELFTLKVEYMAPVMGMPGEADNLEPQKTMIYTVSRTASSMTLKSIAYNPEDGPNAW